MFVALLAIIFLITSSTPILASDRNIFGLHLTQTSDIELAAKTINSSGGDWGWVTIVIRPDQLDLNTWQDFFNQCRRLHLIPIIRLATLSDNGIWQKPQFSTIDSYASFFQQLNWPTSKHHLILFNEVNRAQEWGGSINPKEYADISLYAINKFKQINPEFIILSSGLDLAAPNKTGEFKSAKDFYQEAVLYQPQLFELFDGLSSHSYPNHGFIGSPADTGQHSIKGYLWELSLLKSMGIKKELPIFITETGWPHREGESSNNKFFSQTTTGQFLISALQSWQNDPKVQAVTPFIYNYPYAPFDHFSWLLLSGQLYPEYQKLITLPKNQNQPSQTTSYQYVSINLPIFMFPGKTYSGQIFLKNTGQSIWGQGETEFCLSPKSSSNLILSPLCTNQNLIQPGYSQSFSFTFSLNSTSSEKSLLSWEALPQFEIKPILPLITNASIYQPDNSVLSKVKSFLQQLLP